MRRALGKGLAQLLGEQSDVQPNELELDQIQANVNQPRKRFDEDALEELAESIRAVGILQPIVVRPIAENRYEIIAGERRFRAAKLAGLTSVPVTVRSAENDATLQMALIENVQREDISALECAWAYKQLSEDFGFSHEQIAQRVGKSRVAISNTLRLLRLPEEVQEAIGSGLITEGHARALLTCESEGKLRELFYKVVDQGMTVRETERAARAADVPKAKAERTKAKGKPADKADPNWSGLEEALSTYFGSPVKLEAGQIGGKLSIEFYSDDDLQRILDILGVHL